LLTEIFAPAVQAAAMPIVVALHATGDLATGLGWGALAAVFSSAIPYGVIWLGVRRGRLTDHHIGVREQRRGPLVLGLLSVLVGLAVLVVANAPAEVVAMVVVMFTVLLAVTLVNQVWKLSAHAAVTAGSVTVLVLAFGPVLLAAALVVAAVGWSRVQLRDHTVGQVMTGAVAGAVIATVVFAQLR
jgi:hypothetical protein